MPWWLSGISHHMSGYSAVMFVGYAAIAYTYGFVLYVWWALGITIAMVVGAFVFVPAVAPAAPAARRRLAAGVPEDPLQPADPAGARLERYRSEGRRRRRQVGRDRHPARGLRRRAVDVGHPAHRRRHPRLLHDRRSVGGRADRHSASSSSSSRRGRRCSSPSWASSAASRRCGPSGTSCRRATPALQRPVHASCS